MFKGYSKSYKKSLDFKTVKKGSTVNLTMTEEMLGSLDLLTERNGSLTIGYEKGDEINGKVEGNRLGTYGNPKPVTKPRDFLGLSQTALNNILRKYPTNNENIRAQNVELTLKSRDRAKELAIDTRRDDS